MLRAQCKSALSGPTANDRDSRSNFAQQLLQSTRYYTNNCSTQQVPKAPPNYLPVAIAQTQFIPLTPTNFVTNAKRVDQQRHQFIQWTEPGGACTVYCKKIFILKNMLSLKFDRTHEFRDKFRLEWSTSWNFFPLTCKF